jgi:hypothetical protein
VVAALITGGVFLLGMAVTAGYAARMLPAGARVPLNAGVPEHSVWLSKRAGLAAWLGIGLVAFVVLASLTSSSLADNWAHSVRVVLLPSAMTVVLAAEAGAVIVARRSATAPANTETPAGLPNTGTIAPAASPDSQASASDEAPGTEEDGTDHLEEESAQSP